MLPSFRPCINLAQFVVDENGDIFRDFIELLQTSLASVGYPAQTTVNRLRPHCVNIILGATVFLPPETLTSIAAQGIPYIVFQSESLDDTNGFVAERPYYLEFLRTAAQVWDYSQTNVAWLKERRTVEAKYIPVGYSSELQRIDDQERQDIDVLFCGFISPRRQVLLEELQRRKLQTTVLTGVYGEERDRIIGRAKICLNLHQFETDHLEQLRVSYLLNNHRFVISESSDQDPYGGGVVFAPYERLAETCETYARSDHDEERRRIAHLGWQNLQSTPMASRVDEALQELFTSYAARSSVGATPAEAQAFVPATSYITAAPRVPASESRERSPAHGPSRSACIVLVPIASSVEPACEESLRGLEQLGYNVRRVRGYSAIDQGRCQLATDALAEGFEETMWVDSDISFDPAAVDRLRSHNLPFTCGLYPQKGRKALACHARPGTSELVFGQNGGLAPVHYAGAGFMLIRRQVYETIQQKLDLPVCNARFGRPLVPWFLPLVIREKWGVGKQEAPQAAAPPVTHWYLAEDFAFCERARRCGIELMADTTIRLHHHGSYGYTWENAGREEERFASFHFRLG